MDDDDFFKDILEGGKEIDEASFNEFMMAFYKTSSKGISRFSSVSQAVDLFFFSDCGRRS